MLLERRAWISSRIAPCHASYLSASEKAISSKVGEDVTREIGAAEEAADAVRSAGFGSRRRRTIGC